MMLKKLSRKVYQTRFTDDLVVGNCVEACFASYFDLDISELPEDRDHLKRFIFRRFRYIIKFVDGPPPVDGNIYLVSYSVSSKYKTDVLHMVLWKNGRIIHDPRKDRVRLVKIVRHWLLIHRPKKTQAEVSKRFKQILDGIMKKHTQTQTQKDQN